MGRIQNGFAIVSQHLNGHFKKCLSIKLQQSNSSTLLAGSRKAKVKSAEFWMSCEQTFSTLLPVLSVVHMEWNSELAYNCSGIGACILIRIDWRDFMNKRLSFIGGFVLAAALIGAISYSSRPDKTLSGSTHQKPRTLTVALSGKADVVGSDSTALQKAADMLRAGDILEIGPGTYQMNNSLLIPSGVTVRGVPGQTILQKSPGVESLLTEDGDYGES